MNQWSRLHKPQPQGKLSRGPVESSSQTATTRQTATWTSGVVFTNRNHKANCHVDQWSRLHKPQPQGKLLVNQWSRLHKPQPQGKLSRGPVESSSQTATTRQTATWTSGVVFTNRNHKANSEHNESVSYLFKKKRLPGELYHERSHQHH